jgi:hypothetical protein
MNATLETLEAEVLQLPKSERTHLLERLIASLDTDAALETAWELEADRREAELANGDAMLAPAAHSMARLRASLRS